MADSISCSGCGLDLTDEGVRGSCPVCGETARVFSVSASLEATANIDLHGSVVNTVVRPKTVEAKVEIPTPTIDATSATKLAAHYEHIVHSYPPSEGSDTWVVLVANAADGSVPEVVVANDPRAALDTIRQAIEDELT